MKGRLIFFYIMASNQPEGNQDNKDIFEYDLVMVLVVNEKRKDAITLKYDSILGLFLFQQHHSFANNFFLSF